MVGRVAPLVRKLLPVPKPSALSSEFAWNMSCLRRSSSSITISSHLFLWESSRNHQLNFYIAFWITFNDIDLKCCHHCVEVTHLFQLQEVPPPVRDYRLSSTRKRRCGLRGRGHYHGNPTKSSRWMGSKKKPTRFCLEGWKKRKRHKPKKTSWNRLQPVSACLFQTTGVQRTKMPMLM